ncbi:Uncharacterised protein [Chlamydia abortus]|nr:Uncharacterised protein [Chlamydia abortus]
MFAVAGKGLRVTLNVDFSSAAAAAGAAATAATAVGSIPNSSFNPSISSITSLIFISFNDSINSFFVNFAMINSPCFLNYFSKIIQI